VAIYTKVHHAAIDGVSGNDILTALLDTSPEGRPDDELGDAPPRNVEPAPSAIAMLVRSALSLAGHPLRGARISYSLAMSMPTLAVSPARPHLPVVDRLLGRDRHVVLASPSVRAPSTPFNKPIGPHRRWAFRSVPFDDVRAVKNAAGATVNDVVMALCAGAMRRWLDDHDALPDAPLVAAVPVSVRTDAQVGTGGNRVSSIIVALPTNLADPAERLAAAHEAMRAAKEQHGAMPADLLADVTQFAMPALAGQAARLSARLRLVERINPFNLIISNIPGPNVPLYYAGARLLAYYPLSAIAEGQGLNITVMSYGGGLHFGLIGDRDLVPDLDAMAGYLVDELKVLVRAVVPAAPPTATRAAATTKHKKRA
jgi:diacylglycerol O-acyltransferase / wax synthase